MSIVTIIGLIRFGNLEFSLTTLSKVKWSWFSLVFVSFYMSVIARGWRWRRILKTMGWTVNTVYAIALLTAGLFTSAILPARAGDVARVAMLKQDYKVPISQSIASIATERALDVFAILSMAIIGAWWALPGRVPAYVVQLVVVVAGLLVFGIFGLVVIPSIENFLREGLFFRRIVPLKIWSLYQKLLDFGFSLIQGIRILGQNPGALLFIIGESFVIWFYDALMVYFALLSIGVLIPPSATLFTAMISDLATAVPITPGALGQFDATMIALLSLFGVTTADASLSTLLVRIAQLWTFIPVSGLITYIFGFSRVLNLSSNPLASTATTTQTSSIAES
ncbi:MAG: flippase-like domain-containing protein [Anaerolineae bacterium]|nr:flippase-like domain-containing protein [Anaerolineae bacterium]